MINDKYNAGNKIGVSDGISDGVMNYSTVNGRTSGFSKFKTTEVDDQRKV
jgi:hypothetical protein